MTVCSFQFYQYEDLVLIELRPFGFDHKFDILPVLFSLLVFNSMMLFKLLFCVMFVAFAASKMGYYDPLDQKTISDFRTRLRKSQLRLEWERPLLFVHLHKTGGSNFQVYLNEFCGLYRLKCGLLYAGDEEKSGVGNPRNPRMPHLTIANVSEASSYDIIQGHRITKAFRDEYLPKSKKYKFVTLLREPLSRYLSLYFHLRGMTTAPLQMPPSLGELMQSTTRGDRDGAYLFDFTVQDFEKDLIPFLYERYDLSCHLIFSIMGAPDHIPASISNYNSAGNHNKRGDFNDLLSYESMKNYSSTHQKSVDFYLNAVHQHYLWMDKLRQELNLDIPLIRGDWKWFPR